MVVLAKINSNVTALLIFIFITIFRTVKYNQLSHMMYISFYKIEGINKINIEIFVIIYMDRISRIIDHTFSLSFFPLIKHCYQPGRHVFFYLVLYKLIEDMKTHSYCLLYLKNLLSCLLQRKPFLGESITKMPKIFGQKRGFRENFIVFLKEQKTDYHPITKSQFSIFKFLTKIDYF